MKIKAIGKTRKVAGCIVVTIPKSSGIELGEYVIIDRILEEEEK